MVSHFRWLVHSGMDGDVLTFSDDIAASLRLFNLEAHAVSTSSSAASTTHLSQPSQRWRQRNNRIGALSLSQLVSTKLYSHRTKSPYYVEPIIAGLVASRSPSPRDDAGIPALGDHTLPSSATTTTTHQDTEIGREASHSDHSAANRGYRPVFVSGTDAERSATRSPMVPFLCSQDSLGAPMFATDFVCRCCI